MLHLARGSRSFIASLRLALYLEHTPCTPASESLRRGVLITSYLAPSPSIPSSSLAAAAAMRRCFSSRSRYDETAEAREGGGQAGLCRREGSTRRPKGPPGMGWRGASWRRAAGSEPSVRSVRGGISV